MSEKFYAQRVPADSRCRDGSDPSTNRGGLFHQSGRKGENVPRLRSAILNAGYRGSLCLRH